MTLYFPADARSQAPQIIHSHKLFQDFWIPKSTIVRESHISEDLSTRRQTDFYFLNSCPARTKAGLHMMDGVTGAEVAQKTDRTSSGEGMSVSDRVDMGGG